MSACVCVRAGVSRSNICVCNSLNVVPKTMVLNCPVIWVKNWYRLAEGRTNNYPDVGTKCQREAVVINK